MMKVTQLERTLEGKLVLNIGVSFFPLAVCNPSGHADLLRGLIADFRGGRRSIIFVGVPPVALR